MRKMDISFRFGGLGEDSAMRARPNEDMYIADTTLHGRVSEQSWVKGRRRAAKDFGCVFLGV